MDDSVNQLRSSAQRRRLVEGVEGRLVEMLTLDKRARRIDYRVRSDMTYSFQTPQSDHFKRT